MILWIIHPGVILQFPRIIFDFDGTICDTASAITAIIIKTCELMDAKAPSPQAINQIIAQGAGLEATFMRLMEDCAPIQVTVLGEWASTYRQLYAEHALEFTKLYPGIRETLEKIFRSKREIFVLSNKSQVALEDTLAHFHLDKMLALILGHGPGQKSKPDPEAFVKNIQPSSSLTGEAYLMVGDTVADLLFARNIAAKSCWAKYGFGHHPQCMELQPDYTAEKPLHVLEILDL